jgi:uncharacterized protein
VRFLLFILLLQYSSLVFAKSIAQNVSGESQTLARIAIVIDDIGYRKTDSEVLALPGNLTLSILPHTPFGKILAEQAYQKNHDILLHIPMEAENAELLGPGALTVDMNEQKIRASLNSSFNEIPFAIGINNHMGSRLTQLYSPMVWTMRYLQEKKLLFLDSLTSNKSKAGRIARYFNVPELNRSIFLDNHLDQDYINKQFSRLVWQALNSRSNTAIAIAHPHPETMQALARLIPLLAKKNIELVAISQLLPTSKNQELSAVGSD